MPDALAVDSSQIVAGERAERRLLADRRLSVTRTIDSVAVDYDSAAEPVERKPKLPTDADRLEADGDQVQADLHRQEAAASSGPRPVRSSPTCPRSTPASIETADHPWGDQSPDGSGPRGGRHQRRPASPA